MTWKPPSEDEFNDNWITHLEALDVHDERMADDVDKWALIQRLQAGQLLAVARTAQVRSDISGVFPFVFVSAGAWQRMDQNSEFYFWKTGDLVVTEVRDGVIRAGKQRYFDVRFDPGTFNGKPPPSNGTVNPSASAAAGPPTRLKDISRNEAERVSRAILAGWPESTEKEAHAKALAIYPENKVPREWFLEIFRLIRGPKKRGVPAKIRL